MSPLNSLRGVWKGSAYHLEQACYERCLLRQAHYQNCKVLARTFSLQVAVGVGTLAGSTIMLLTIAWAGSLLCARCDLNEQAWPSQAEYCQCGSLSALLNLTINGNDTKM